MVMDKSGQAKGMRALMLFVLIVLGVIGIFIMGIFVYGATLVDQTFSSLNVTIGNVSFQESYNDTLGIGINAILDSADDYGMGLLLGMVLLIVISSFIFHEKQKTWIVLELIILIVSFIFAVAMQRGYDTVINSSSVLLDIYSVDLVNSSTFILSLPVIVPIVWAFIVILSYGLFRKKESPFGDIGA